jgi:hypothetical protein
MCALLWVRPDLVAGADSGAGSCLERTENRRKNRTKKYVTALVTQKMKWRGVR